MPFEIRSEDNERTLRRYSEARDRVREVMGQRVYPNVTLAIRCYDALDAVVAELAAGDENDQELVAYHAALMQPIAQYIADLRAAAESVITIMRTIETAQPGTFGIQVPEDLS